MTVKLVLDIKALDVHAYQIKSTSEAILHGKVNLTPDNGSADSSIQRRSWQKCFRTHSSVDTVGYETAQQTSTRVRLLT